MSFSVKSIFTAATDLLPGGSLVRSIVEGAGSLLLRKAAGQIGIEEKQIDAVLARARQLSHDDEEMRKALEREEEARRQFELAFFGRAADLSPRAQLWRTITRPILSLGLVGLFALGVLIQYSQQVLAASSSVELLSIPAEVLDLAKWVVAFWFTSRGVEKVVSMFK